MQVRIDSLQKDVKIHKIQIKNEETKRQAKIDSAELNLIIDSSKPIDYSALEGDYRAAKRD